MGDLLAARFEFSIEGNFWTCSHELSKWTTIKRPASAGVMIE